MRPLFELYNGPLLKSGLGPLGRYCTHQETISGRQEKVSSIWPWLKWPGEGSLFESDSNKRRRVKMRQLFELSPGPLLKSGLGPLASIAPTRRPLVGHLNRSIFHLTKIGMGLERGHYLSRTRINAGGPNAVTIWVIPGPLLKSGLGPLARCCNHQFNSIYSNISLIKR